MCTKLLLVSWVVDGWMQPEVPPPARTAPGVCLFPSLPLIHCRDPSGGSTATSNLWALTGKVSPCSSSCSHSHSPSSHFFLHTSTAPTSDVLSFLHHLARSFGRTEKHSFIFVRVSPLVSW